MVSAIRPLTLLVAACCRLCTASLLPSSCSLRPEHAERPSAHPAAAYGPDGGSCSTSTTKKSAASCKSWAWRFLPPRAASRSARFWIARAIASRSPPRSSRATAALTGRWFRYRTLRALLFFLDEANGWMIKREAFWFTADTGRTWKRICNQLKPNKKLGEEGADSARRLSRSAPRIRGRNAKIRL